MHTTFNTRTFQNHPCLLPKRLNNPPPNILCPLPFLHQHSPNPRHQPPRLLKSPPIQIRNNNRLRPRRRSSQQCNKPNRPRTTNNHWIRNA